MVHVFQRQLELKGTQKALLGGVNVKYYVKIGGNIEFLAKTSNRYTCNH